MVRIENANGGQTIDHSDFRILGLAASLRRASFHRGIVRAAHEVAPEWMSCEGFDLARIPYFNQDIEDQGHPEPVNELREKIRTYDAVLIATPEYDYAIPGVLTAALGLVPALASQPHALPSQAGRDRRGEPRRKRDGTRTDGPEANTLASPSLRDARTADTHPLLAPEVRSGDSGHSMGRRDPREAATLPRGTRRVGPTVRGTEEGSPETNSRETGLMVAIATDFYALQRTQ